MPALAFGSHYFVFKERPGTHRSSRSWCRVSQRTVPDVLQLLESLLRAPGGRGPVRRGCHLIRCAREGQRVRARKYPPGAPPRAEGSLPIVPAFSANAADTTDGSELGFPPPSPSANHPPVRPPSNLPHPWWRAVSHSGPPHATRCRQGTTGFPLPLCANQSHLRERALPVEPPRPTDALPCNTSMLHRRCCTAVTRP